MPRVLVLVAVIALGAVPAAAQGKGPAATRFLETLGEVRADHSLRPLLTAPRLLDSSQHFSEALMLSNRFEHGGIAPGRGFQAVGEALATHRGWTLAPRRVLHMLLASPPHRALLLNPSFNRVGVGYVRGRLGRSRATTWVVHLGRRGPAGG